MQHFFRRIGDFATSYALFYIHLGFVVVANIIDAVLTVAWVSADLAIEANPLMAALLEYGFVWFFVVKTTVVLAAALMLYYRRHMLLARLLIVPVVIVYASILMLHLNALHMLGVKIL